ncbi:MAG: integrase family protein [Rhodospirillales bacterium]|nr:integrase family protein [Rhodospirillales bacterium]
MPTLKFTEQAVAEAKAPAADRLDLWDEELPGFGLRVSGAGRKSWQVMYRVAGRKRRMTLGRYPALSLEIARDAAEDALREVARGRDPAAERASMTGGALTFEAFAKAYLERHAKPNKLSWAEDARMIERDLLPAWRRRPAETVTRRDVIELLERVVRRGHPTAANRRLALIRKMYAWGLEVDLVPATPVVAVRAPAREAPRERVLGEAELAALWSAWERIGWPFGPLGKLMLLTAQRRRAVAGLRLADIGLASRIWTLPPEAAGGRVGGRGAHAVPLSSFAIEILTSLPRTDSPYVFPARGHPGRPVSGFSKAARRMAELSGVGDCRLGDLRRTAADGMARQGVPPHVLGAILNRGTGGRPGLAGPAEADIETMRLALEAWAERVREIVRAGASDRPAAAP